MKKLFLTFIFLTIIFSIFSQQNNTPYDFPVKPGTDEWKKLKSGKEMAMACNIPESVLQNLNTPALVITCLDYPLFNEVLSANNLQIGFLALLNNFNGFNELINRKDAAKELLVVYQKLNVRDLSPDWSPEVSKAEEDKHSMKYKGNYMGKIYSSAYQDQSVFYVKMALGSGGLAGYIYDCSGNTVSVEPSDVSVFDRNAQQGKLIYSNVP